MAKTYIRLLNLHLRHAYFEEGKSKNLVLEASPKTKALMHRLDMRVAGRGSEMSVFWGLEERFDETQPDGIYRAATLHSADFPIVLTFSICTTSPNFYHYTDIPFDASAQGLQYYFGTTLHQEDSILSAVELAVTPPFVSDADMVPCKGSVQYIQFPVDQTNQTREFILRDAGGQIVAQNEVEKFDGTYGLAFHKMNEWGAYKLQMTVLGNVEQIEHEVDLHYLPEDVQIKSVGIVQFILTADSIPANKPEAEATVPTFNISFANRATRWRYIFLNKNQLEFDQVKLQLEEETFSAFSATAEPEAASTPEKYQIDFDEPRPLMEQQKDKFRAELLSEGAQNGNGTTGNATVVAKLQLPTPNVQRIYPIRKAEQEFDFFSTMYIYL